MSRIAREPAIPTHRREQSTGNPGLPFDLEFVCSLPVDHDDLARRADALVERKSTTRKDQIARLLRTVTSLDLTSLSPDDTPESIRQLCARASHPIRQEILDGLGVSDLDLHVAAVCVYPPFVQTARDLVGRWNVRVAAAAFGSPTGRGPFERRLEDIRDAVAAGADEVDVVITLPHAQAGDWRAVYDEFRSFRSACRTATMKTILGVGELPSLDHVARASLVAMAAGADFIKTSTGMESVNATLPAGLAMARAIRSYHEETGHVVGLKPAGGLRSARSALQWILLVEAELGDSWLHPDRFRIGASRLLTSVETELERIARS